MYCFGELVVELVGMGDGRGLMMVGFFCVSVRGAL